MSKVMFQFREQHKRPTLDEVCASFDLRPNEVDSEFDVLQSDFQEGLYVVLVDFSAQERLKAKLKTMGADTDPAVGIFSNPGIEPFGVTYKELQEVGEVSWEGTTYLGCFGCFPVRVALPLT